MSILNVAKEAGNKLKEKSIKLKEKSIELMNEAKAEAEAETKIEVDNNKEEVVDLPIAREKISKSSGMPCDSCRINDICNKAYSIKMPKYDKEIFTVDVKCSRLITD